MLKEFLIDNVDNSRDQGFDVFVSGFEGLNIL